MRPSRFLLWLGGLPTTTFEGKVFSTATLAFGIFAVASGDNLKLMVLAAMVSVLLVSGLAAGRNLGGLTVSRDLPERVRAGDGFDVSLTVTNHRRLTPALAVAVQDALQARGPGRDACVIERIPPGATVTVGYRARIARRGSYPLRGVKLSTRFPFGLFEKESILPAYSSVLVTPREESVGADVLVGAADRRLGDGRERRRSRGGEELRGLREYRRGDPVGRVAWKASARRGELLVRQLDRRRAERTLVLLDPRDAPGGGFERTIRLAAGVVERARRVRRPCTVALFTPELALFRRVDRAAARDPLLETLAFVGPVRLRTVHDLLLQLDPPIVRGARVVVVTPARPTERLEIEESVRRRGGDPITLRSRPKRAGPTRSRGGPSRTGPPAGRPADVV